MTENPMPETTPEQKIAQARQLLISATNQRRREYQAEIAAQRCTCGHRRDLHTVSASVNYTEGLCMAKRCKCRWFNLKPLPEGRTP